MNINQPNYRYLKSLSKKIDKPEFKS